MQSLPLCIPLRLNSHKIIYSMQGWPIDTMMPQVAPEAGLGHQASKIWHQGVKLLKQMVTSQLRLKTSLMSIMCLHVCPPACLSACIQVCMMMIYMHT